jgi:hypothetical protein
MSLREVYPGDVPDAEFAAVLDRLRDPVPLEVTLLSDDGSWAVHDMPCPVCLDRKAVVDLSGGGFGPCAECSRAGWELRQQRRKGWWERLTRRSRG